MDYSHITSFLDKFKELLAVKGKNNKIISEVITRHISSPINEELIKVKGTTIYIQGSPMLHNEVLIHKEGILRDLKDMMPQIVFTDIR